MLRKRLLISFVLLLFIFALTVPTANAKDGEFDAIVKHLKTKYQAKKVKIPFLWVARFAVKIVRPAGVKSFDITLFEKLQFSRATLDEEMQAAMRNSLSADWSPILRIRSRTGEQVYMYMREAGKDVKIMFVTIDKDEAAVIRAKFNPNKLAEFINNPKIFGISLSDSDQRVQIKDKNEKEEKEETTPNYSQPK
jgi:hypothetical protein